MARFPDDLPVASLGQTTMTRTIQCPQCGVVLNVPDSAAGRKLKCPQCATKFAAPAFSPGDSVIAGPSPASSLFPTGKGAPSSGDIDLPPSAGSSGSIELPTSSPAPTPRKRAPSSDVGPPSSSPAPRKRPTSEFDLPSSAPPPRKAAKPSDVDLPSSPATLGATFELPLFADELPVKGPAKAQAPGPADVNALFQDEPKSARKPKGAEARSKPRRCPDCGGVVGIGMSLCNLCGLDLDTGQRVAPLDLIDDDMPVAHRPEMPALGVMFVGILSIVINVVLVLASLIAARNQGSGMLCLAIVWIFGIYSSVQFLRRKSIRPLFLSLGLAAAIGTVFLIAMPISKANMGDDTIPAQAEAPIDPADPDAPQLRNLAEDIDMSRITWGIAMLLGYAALSIYLNSPPIKREFSR